MRKMTAKQKGKFVGKYFFEMGFSDDEVSKTFEKYHPDYIIDTIIFCEKKSKLNKKYFMSALKNAHALKQTVNNFEDKIVENIKKTKKEPKKKQKTLTEKELQVLNAPMKTYGMTGEQRSFLFKISNQIGMNTFSLYRMAEQYGFEYIYETLVECERREKLSTPAYFIAAVKNDYWNMREVAKNFVNERALLYQDEFNNAQTEQLH